MLLQTSMEWNLEFLGPESEVRGGVRVHCQQREQNTVSSSEGFEDNELFQNHWNLPKTHMDLCTKHELYDLSEGAQMHSMHYLLSMHYRYCFGLCSLVAGIPVMKSRLPLNLTNQDLFQSILILQVLLKVFKGALYMFHEFFKAKLPFNFQLNKYIFIRNCMDTDSMEFIFLSRLETPKSDFISQMVQWNEKWS